MSISILDGIKNTFDLATLRQKTQSLRTPSDWEKGREIMIRYKRETHKQTRLYYAEYDARIKKVLKPLIDKAGAKNRAFTYRLFGADNFNKNVLMRQAHRHVQQDHHQRINRLQEKETNDLSVLSETIEQRDRLREKPKQDFSHAVDRRSAKDHSRTFPRRTHQ